MVRATLESGRRLNGGIQLVLERLQSRLTRAEAHITSLNPQLMLERGYSITQTADGRSVQDADGLAVGEEIGVQFARGRVQAAVTGKKTDADA